MIVWQQNKVMKGEVEGDSDGWKIISLDFSKKCYLIFAAKMHLHRKLLKKTHSNQENNN